VRDSRVYFVVRIAALAEARLTPAVENPVDEMICHITIISYVLMTLFAFPRLVFEFVLSY